MEVDEARERLKAIEPQLAEAPFVEFHAFRREERTLHVAITQRLRKLARKDGLWRTREMAATLKNAAYGYDQQRARSAGGRDGIFVMDRHFHPANAMMHKLFDRYLDKPESGAAEVAVALGVPLDELIPVRLGRTICGYSACWQPARR